MVEVEFNGLSEMQSCRVDAGVFARGDRELLEDLVTAAVNDAHERAKRLHAESLHSLAGGIELPPGVEDALSSLSGDAPSPE
jgi:hypothetical protein